MARRWQDVGGAEGPVTYGLLRAAPWLLVTAGMLLRAQRFASDRSFWLDESMLGLNLIEKPARELLRSLDYVQSAPQGFLLLEKASIDVLGQSEQALRLLPFLASLAGLVLFALVARRLLPPWPALLALALFVVGEPLLYQSSEAKPYSSDVAFALLLTWLALRALDGRSISARTVAPVAVAGTAAVWFSYPAAFVLAAAFAALALRAWEGERRRSLLLLGSIGAIWAASFLVLYTLSSGTIAAVRSSVFAGDAHTEAQLTGLARAAWLSFVDPGGFLPSMRGLVAFCLAVGLLALVRSQRGDWTVLLAGPGALAVAAALLSKYPPGGRFWLFLVPALLVLISLGVQELVTASHHPLLLGIPLVLALAAPPILQALAHTGDVPRREDVRPLLQQLVREWHPGDSLYVYPDAQYALRFYGECRSCGVGRYPFPLPAAPPGARDGLGFPTALASNPPTVLVGRAGDTPAQLLARIDALRGRVRVWFLFSHVRGILSGLDQQQLTLAYLDKIGRPLRSSSEPGAALFLYDLRKPGR